MDRIWSRQAKYERWLQVEVEICRAHHLAGTIPAEDFQQIEQKAAFDLARCDEIEKETKHDLAAFVRNVEESIGPAGRWIHFGATSYDIIDTALGCMLRDSCDVLLEELDALTVVVEDLFKEHGDKAQIGRTHGIHAEPITLGHKFAGWWHEIRRNRKRLEECRAQIAVGKISGAVGINAHIDPDMEKQICERLGLGVDPVSTQIVNRDRHAHLLNTAALLAASLERIATELRNLQRTEILEVQEAFSAGQTGSSAMPHKRNPWSSETVVGLARLVRGHSHAMLESVATWHERDLTNSGLERIIFPDTMHVTHFMIRRVKSILSGLNIMDDNLERNLRLMGDLVFSEHLMVSLIGTGLSRKDAYSIAQRNAHKAWEGHDFQTSVRNDEDVTSRLSTEDLDRVFSLEHHLQNAPKLDTLRD